MELWIDGNEIIIKTPYDIELIGKIKKIPGRQWNSLLKYWKVPYNSLSLKTMQELGFDITLLKDKIERINKETSNRFDILREKIKKTYPFLYEYQVDAVAKGFKNGRLLNIDTMGLGKTIEGFAPMDRWLEKGDINRIIIFCPAAIKWQWKREISKWFNKVSVVIDGDYKNRQHLYKSENKIFIFNYETIVDRINDKGEYITNDFGYIFNLTEKQGLILDEATYIKNPKAKRSLYVKQLKPKYLFALTGTPIENKLIDAYNIGNIVKPDWMNKYEFYSYCIFGDGYGGHGILEGYKNLDIFMERLMEIAIRRTWNDVGIQMPKQVMEERRFQLTPYQRRLEEIILNEIQDSINNGSTIKSVLSKFTLLPMLEDSTQLLNMSKAESLVNFGEVKVQSPKLDYLETLLDEMVDKKIIIFTRFKRMAKLIFEKISEKYKCHIATGETTQQQREEIITKFATDDARIIISTETMAYGVDLPYVTAVINYDIPWKPSTLYQRIHRCYRANSKYDRLLIVNFISEGLETYIYDVMSKKEALFRMVTTFDLKKQLLRFIHHRSST